MSSDAILEKIAQAAVDLVADNSVVGLGTGRAASAFVRVLAKRVADGLRVRGVPTSEATAQLAGQLGIPLVHLNDVDTIDITIDGADEVDPRLDLIKGYGGALVREKIVAAVSRCEVILVGRDKLVPQLGSRGRLPVEVLPFAVAFCRRRLTELGCRPSIRQLDGHPFLSDSGNYVLDCAIEPIEEPQRLEDAIRAIPGVVGTGLFLGIADLVLVGNDNEVRRLERQRETRQP